MTDKVHIAVALEGAGWHPAAWREATARPRDLTTAGYWRDLVRAADDAGIVFATIEDALTLEGRTTEPDAGIRRDRVRGRLDALLVASFLAPLTRRIGLVPTVTTTHPEPFHLATGLQTLDHASLGRAGVRVVAGSSPQERANFGRRSDGPVGFPVSGRVEDDPTWEAAFREAGEVVEVIRLLADSWEDEAIIRDVESGRFLDRERVHNADFEGEFFSITGASIVPRSPQGQPLVTALAHQSVPYRFAAEHADVVFITPRSAEDASAIIAEVGRTAAEVREEPEPLRVFADLLVLIEETAAQAQASWNRLEERAPITTDAQVVVGTAEAIADEIRALAAAGVDGIRLRPARLPADLIAITEQLIPLLAVAGVLAEDDAPTLRQRLGLPRRSSRFTAQEVSA